MLEEFSSSHQCHNKGESVNQRGLLLLKDLSYKLYMQGVMQNEIM